MPAAMHSFYLRNMYQENRLVTPGGITLAGVPIDLGRIKQPSFILSTKEDHIAPWTSTYAATRLYGGPVKFVLSASGHIAGVVNPPAAEKYCYWTNGRPPKTPEGLAAEGRAACRLLVAGMAEMGRALRRRQGAGAPSRRRRPGTGRGCSRQVRRQPDHLTPMRRPRPGPRGALPGPGHAPMLGLVLGLILAAAAGLAAPAAFGQDGDRNGDGLRLPGIQGDDDRRRIASTDWPWTAIGRVNRTTGGYCTGALVAPDRVLTAAHCLWDPRQRRMRPASVFYFIAGYDRGTMAAHAGVSVYRVAPGYRAAEREDPRQALNDWAVLDTRVADRDRPAATIAADGRRCPGRRRRRRPPDAGRLQPGSTRTCCRSISAVRSTGCR